jgi:anti-sigma-K factor RskA
MTRFRSVDALERIAAEYVLGTLRGAARRGFEREARRNAEARRAIAAWSRRLGPLVELGAPAAPPEHSWRRIEARIGGGRRREP